MKLTSVRVLGSWLFLALALGTFIVLPGCRTVQGAGQDIETVGRTGEQVIEEEF